MLSIQSAYQHCHQTLSSIFGSDEARAMAKWLFNDKYDLSEAEIRSNAEQAFKHEVALAKDLERLLAHEPLQYVIGYTYFGPVKVKVNQEVLIPRPETEELLDWVKADVISADLVFADVCTGSGCIALWLKQHFPHAQIMASDIALPSLALAKQSELDQFEKPSIQWLLNDVLTEAWPAQPPNIVVCNPPYIMATEKTQMLPNVLSYEPHRALFVDGSDPLLFYKRVIDLFVSSAVIYFELNPLTAQDLLSHCERLGLSCELKSDWSGHCRFAKINQKKA
jgi:release factor glutamine methyltransferase